MSWRAVVFDALSDGEWHIARDLFAPIESAIAAHYATRHMARMRGDATVVKLTDVDVGRFRYFASYLYDLDIDIENCGARRRIDSLSRVRLRPAGRCPSCGSLVYRKDGRRDRGFCSACNHFCRWIPLAPPVAKHRMTVAQLLSWVYHQHKAHQKPLWSTPPADAVAVHRMISTFAYPWGHFLIAYGYTGCHPELPTFRCQPVKWIRALRSWNSLWARAGKDEVIYDRDYGIHVRWTPIKYTVAKGDDLLTAAVELDNYEKWQEAMTEFSRLVKSLNLETIEVI